MSASRGPFVSTSIFCGCPFCLKSSTLLHALWKSEEEGFWPTCSRCNLPSCSGFCFPTSTTDKLQYFKEEQEGEESVWDSLISSQPNSPRLSLRDVDDEDVEVDDYCVVRNEVEVDVEEDCKTAYNDADDKIRVGEHCLEYHGNRHDEFDENHRRQLGRVENKVTIECYLVPNTRFVTVGEEVIPEYFLLSGTKFYPMLRDLLKKENQQLALKYQAF